MATHPSWLFVAAWQVCSVTAKTFRLLHPIIDACGVFSAPPGTNGCGSSAPCMQTETPEQLKARNAKRAPGTKMVNVVQRQAVTVLSRGTLIDPEMVAAHPDAAYVLAGAQL